MLPGAAAVWLTSDPNGNKITEAHLVYWRKYGQRDLIAEYEAGRRRFIFGDSKHGCARLTVELLENFKGLFNYLELMTAIYGDAPAALAFIAEMQERPTGGFSHRLLLLG